MARMAKKINGQDFPPKIVDDDKLFSKLLSKEKPSKQGEASFRVLYYGGAAGSVPFLWESQPGTPKHPLSANPPPPLTPPPSYQYSPRATPLLRKHSKNSKFFNSIFPRVASKKIGASSFSPPATSSSSSSSSFSSSYSLPSTPFNPRKSGSFKARSRSAVRFGLDGKGECDREVGMDSPTSTLCFGPKNGRPSSARRFRGVKKVVLSIVGHGGAD